MAVISGGTMIDNIEVRVKTKIDIQVAAKPSGTHGVPS
jgi:hypothetical protein